MVPFLTRKDAGEKLARALEKYRGQDVLVLAIPRGGVAVAYEVATRLAAELSLAISRKLPFPTNPEAGFGAVAEDGGVFIVDEARPFLEDAAVQRIIKEQKREILRRVAVLRRGEPLPPVAGRTVIIVDDGIAMGSTMRATVEMCRRLKARTVVVAAPVSGREVAAEMGSVADDVVILEQPAAFRAVAQAYVEWYDVPDDEVIALMDHWRQNRPRGDAA